MINARDEDSPLYDKDRNDIHDLLQGFGGPDEGVEGMLLGWVTVAEWMLPNGLRSLTFLNADANGNPTPSWQVVGYLRNALARCENQPIIIQRDPDSGDDE